LSAKVFLSIQNISVVICCAIIAVYLWLTHEFNSTTQLIVAILIIVINCVANLASLGSKIVVEKDWIVVIAGEDTNRLASINSVFRTIDLTCLVLAPLLAGILFDVSLKLTAVFIGAWNLISVCLEYFLLVRIYHEYPDLARKEHLENVSSTEKVGFGQRVRKTLWSWKMYYQHPVRNAGLALSLLYMTVLGFDNITYGYCLLQCVSASILGAMVGVSAIIGVLGSLSFPLLRKRINVTRTGEVGMIALVLALSACVASLWIPGSPFELYSGSGNATVEERSTTIEDDCYVESFWSVGALLFGIIFARYGLWLSDLSITQILQESVSVEVRGTIGGVQGGLNSVMDTIKFILVIILPEEESFGWLVLASFGSICLGWFFYTIYAVKNWGGVPKEPPETIEEGSESTESAERNQYYTFDGDSAKTEK
jgi:iron-regulated transporter 1